MVAAATPAIMESSKAVFIRTCITSFVMSQTQTSSGQESKAQQPRQTNFFSKFATFGPVNFNCSVLILL